MQNAEFTDVTPAVLRAGPVRARRRLFRSAALGAADIVVTVLAIGGLVGVLRVLGAPLEGGTGSDWAMLTLLWGALLVALHKTLGLYSIHQRSPFERFREHVLACAILSTTIAAALATHLHPLMLFVSWCVAFALLTLWGLIARGAAQAVLVRFDLWRDPVVLLGDPDAMAELARNLDAEPRLGLRAARLVPLEGAPFVGAAVDVALDQLAGSGERADCVILLSTGDGEQDWRIASELSVPKVLVLHDAGSLQTLWIQPRSVGNAVGLELRKGLLLPGNLRFKRLFDLAVTVPMVLLAAPLMLLAALAIMLVDPGNPFHVQRREGHRGRAIGVLKLRTMFRDADSRLARHLADDPAAADEWAGCFKLRSDPRVLPIVGSFLRRSSIDELPQLFNVVCGQMSLVGPRPFPFYHLEAFDPGFRGLRASVMPGISGYWQITARSDADLSAQKRLDVFYIRNWSVWLDLYILVHTMPAVLQARGAR